MWRKVDYSQKKNMKIEKHSQETVGTETIKASKWKKNTDFFFTKSQYSSFQEKFIAE